MFIFIWCNYSFIQRESVRLHIEAWLGSPAGMDGFQVFWTIPEDAFTAAVNEGQPAEFKMGTAKRQYGYMMVSLSL